MISVTNPEGLPWDQWAGAVAQDLSASYTIANSAGESLWIEWATELFNTPGLAELGLPDPRGFPDWRDWARAFIAVGA